MQARIKQISSFLATTVFLIAAAFAQPCAAQDTNAAAGTKAFPNPSEVLQGRMFRSEFEREVAFLQGIHDRYASHWPELLAANITVDDYVRDPAKLLRFIEELGTAMRNRNDEVASTHLGAILSDEAYYANTNAYRPQIRQAAIAALLGFGSNGTKALADSFTEQHYRNDSGNLEELAIAIGQAKVADPKLAKALAATAFDFTTANGGSYPGCTKVAVSNLLSLPGGADAVRSRLKLDAVLDNPGRFQSVMDGITTARASTLTTNLVEIQAGVKARLAGLTNTAGDYRDDLQELEARMQRTMGALKEPRP
jgi:hypothetical protein